MASSGSESEFEVDYILDQRKKGRSIEYKVRWKGFGEEEDSWEPARNLKFATKAINAFKNKQKEKPADETPSSSSRSVTKRKSAAAASQQSVTTTTRTVTRTETFSDASDNETPITRRSTRTEKIIETRAGGKVTSVKKSCWFSAGGCSIRGCFTAMKNDLALVIYMLCMMVIAGTFIYERL